MRKMRWTRARALRHPPFVFNFYLSGTDLIGLNSKQSTFVFHLRSLHLNI